MGNVKKCCCCWLKQLMKKPFLISVRKPNLAGVNVASLKKLVCETDQNVPAGVLSLIEHVGSAHSGDMNAVKRLWCV